MARAGRLAFLLALAGCATQPPHGKAPGFLMGLLHGLEVPFSLVGSLFLRVRIYAFPNAGFGYDLGFVLGFGLLILLSFLLVLPRLGGFITRNR